MAAKRIVHVDTPTDNESQYWCDCGFDAFLSEQCDCPQCVRLRESPGLPLKVCPDCETEFEIET